MSRRWNVVFAVAAVLIVADGLRAQTEQRLYTFSGYPDGGSPSSNLVMDAAGNLYGTSMTGGAYEAGEVYELSRNRNGKLDADRVVQLYRQSRRSRSLLRGRNFRQGWKHQNPHPTRVA